MRQKIAAVLLSALVFPGLGQLYNQDRRKGVALVIATNGLLGLVLLTGLILFSREYTLVFFPRPLTSDMVKMLLIDTLTHPVFWVPFGLLVALWGYGVVDAVRGAGPPPSEEP
jgi:O-antigen/teichoic acid export membrane protein